MDLYTNPERPDAAAGHRRPDLLALVAAAGLGATAMYLFDPRRGRRRRHFVSDKLVHAAHVAEEAVEATAHDVANHARGAAAVAKRRLEDDTADDIVITERVRSVLGRVVSHPSAVLVAVEQGRVTLGGPVLADEAEQLVECVGDVRGVVSVADHLERHESPANVPALQGGQQPSHSRFEFFQENWTPTARLLATVTGGTLAAVALRSGRRRTPFTAPLGVAGAALALRGLTNMPFQRLLGIGGGRRGIEVQKSINIGAPIDEVFDWLTAWDRWPQWMSHVREVTTSGGPGEGERTHWVVDGPAGVPISWDAIVTRVRPPELIAWKTVEGSSIKHAGWLRLIATDEGFTRVDVRLTYNPTAGAAGHAIAALFRRDPKHQLDDDLARLKITIETRRPPHDAAARGETSEAGPMSAV